MKINMNMPFINKDTKAGDQRDRANVLAPEAPKTEEGKNDVVRLSERSRMIAKATELAAGAPDVRVNLVNDLKARIGAGTYNITGQVVADSMLRKSITEV
jgi:flagellar biosynthesis anti-sigma factor FlgM